MMQKPVASTTKTILLIPRNSTLRPLGFSSFSQQNGAETDGGEQVVPRALMAEKGIRMKRKAFQVLPAVAGLSNRQTPGRSHPHHDLNCRHPHILGAITLLPSQAPGRGGGHVST